MQHDRGEDDGGVRLRVRIEQGAGQPEGVERVGVVVADQQVRCRKGPDGGQFRVQGDDAVGLRLDPRGDVQAGKVGFGLQFGHPASVPAGPAAGKERPSAQRNQAGTERGPAG